MHNTCQNRSIIRLAALTAAGLALSLALPVNSASAGFFEMLFGGRRHSAPPPVAPPVAPLLRALGDAAGGGMIEGDRRESGPSVSYCVRLCDGHPFPVQGGNSSPAQACSSMCPAAKTKVFAGGSVDSATASDGKRYSDLPTAFAYRKQIVADCTCNGKSAGGLVRMDVKSDPTLRPGDIVATDKGLASFRGTGKGNVAEFSPIQDRKLAAIQIRPAPKSNAALTAHAEAPPPKAVEEPASKEKGRRVQR